jgi:indolepyruvate ferredoxin oxidoreductase
VTLLGARPAEHVVTAAAAEPPEPTRPVIGAEPWNLLMAGVGGQGVSSLAAILAQAAHLEGRPVRSLDFLGLAQKGGGVYAQLRVGAVGAAPDAIAGARIGAGSADLLIAADMVVAHGTTARPLLGPARTAAVVNADLAPTAQFVKDTGTRYRAAEMLAAIRSVCRDTVALGGATRVTAELGDAVMLNVFLLGIAYQRGLVPLSAEAIARALELNGAQVALNTEAFARGRAAALEDLAPPADAAETLDALVARRVADLTAYQSARYAAPYAAFVARVRAAEAAAIPGEERLARAVATQLHRLMAYKDEYEVARLHSLPAWRDALAQGFTGTQRIEMHLAPPVLTKHDPVTGLPAKRAFGPWMLRAMGWLRHGKALRGTALDPFGRTEERRMERALPGEFQAGVERFLAGLPASHATACDWAEAWAGVKGFGPVKARNLAAVRTRLAALASP